MLSALLSTGCMYSHAGERHRGGTRRTAVARPTASQPERASSLRPPSKPVDEQEITLIINPIIDQPVPEQPAEQPTALLPETLPEPLAAIQPEPLPEPLPEPFFEPFAEPLPEPQPLESTTATIQNDTEHHAGQPDLWPMQGYLPAEDPFTDVPEVRIADTQALPEPPELITPSSYEEGTASFLSLPDTSLPDVSSPYMVSEPYAMLEPSSESPPLALSKPAPAPDDEPPPLVDRRSMRLRRRKPPKAQSPDLAAKVGSGQSGAEVEKPVPEPIETPAFSPYQENHDSGYGSEYAIDAYQNGYGYPAAPYTSPSMEAMSQEPGFVPGYDPYASQTIWDTQTIPQTSRDDPSPPAESKADSQSEQGYYQDKYRDILPSAQENNRYGQDFSEHSKNGYSSWRNERGDTDPEPGNFSQHMEYPGSDSPRAYEHASASEQDALRNLSVQERLSRRDAENQTRVDERYSGGMQINTYHEGYSDGYNAGYAEKVESRQEVRQEQQSRQESVPQRQPEPQPVVQREVEYAPAVVALPDRQHQTPPAMPDRREVEEYRQRLELRLLERYNNLPEHAGNVGKVEVVLSRPIEESLDGSKLRAEFDQLVYDPWGRRIPKLEEEYFVVTFAAGGAQQVRTDPSVRVGLDHEQGYSEQMPLTADPFSKVQPTKAFSPSPAPKKATRKMADWWRPDFPELE